MALFWPMKSLTANEPSEKDEPARPYYYRPVERGEPKVINFDIAVYGGTPAGVAAAIQAARMGKKVVLLSFNRHVGGMTSGGLTATDIGKRESIGGLALEFFKNIGRIRDFRPSRAESVFRKMLARAGVTVLLDRPLESVAMKNGRLVSATMETGETVQAAVFVDTTYEGDLLAAAKVSYYVGREPAGAYGESLAGQWQKIFPCGCLPILPAADQSLRGPGRPEIGVVARDIAGTAGKTGRRRLQGAGL